MGAYMYPIIIDRDKKKLNVVRKVKVEDIWSIALNVITDNVKEGETFYILDDTLYINSYRFETDEEQNTRIAKEEKYMLNYNNFHK